MYTQGRAIAHSIASMVAHFETYGLTPPTSLGIGKNEGWLLANHLATMAIKSNGATALFWSGRVTVSGVEVTWPTTKNCASDLPRTNSATSARPSTEVFAGTETSFANR